MLNLKVAVGLVLVILAGLLAGCQSENEAPPPIRFASGPAFYCASSEVQRCSADGPWLYRVSYDDLQRTIRIDAPENATVGSMEIHLRTGIVLYESLNESIGQQVGDRGYVVGIPTGASGFGIGLAMTLLFAHNGTFVDGKAVRHGAALEARGNEVRLEVLGEVEEGVSRLSVFHMRFQDAMWPPRTVVGQATIDGQTSRYELARQPAAPLPALVQKLRPAPLASAAPVLAVPILPEGWGGGRSATDVMRDAEVDVRVRLYLHQHPGWAVRVLEWRRTVEDETWWIEIIENCDWAKITLQYRANTPGTVRAFESGTDCAREMMLVSGKDIVIAHSEVLLAAADLLELSEGVKVFLKYKAPSGGPPYELPDGSLTVYGEQWVIGYAGRHPQAPDRVLEDQLAVFSPADTFLSWTRDVQ